MEKEALLSCLRVRRNSPLNLNFQIKNGLRELIGTGKLPPGTQIPSVKELADICGVSFHTAKYAIRDLVSQGVLEARAGIGTFIPDKKPSTTEIIICCTQPDPGSIKWDFHSQIIEGLIEGYDDLTRRLVPVYLDGCLLSEKEIIASAQAKNADCIIAYKPNGDIAQSLAEVSFKIECISLLEAIPNSMSHSVMIKPERSLRKILQKRMDAGRRSFAFISLQVRQILEDRLSPYGMVYKAFCDFMDEAGIEPAVCHFEEKPKGNSSELSAFQNKLTEDTTLVSLPSGASNLLSERWKGLDVITYTESRQTLGIVTRMGISTLYGGLERCGIEAARLHGELRNSSPGKTPVNVDIEPEMFDFWDDEGFS